jgi:hypothetical protein
VAPHAGGEAFAPPHLHRQRRAQRPPSSPATWRSSTSRQARRPATSTRCYEVGYHPGDTAPVDRPTRSAAATAATASASASLARPASPSVSTSTPSSRASASCAASASSDDDRPTRHPLQPARHRAYRLVPGLLHHRRPHLQRRHDLQGARSWTSAPASSRSARPTATRTSGTTRASSWACRSSRARGSPRAARPA